MSSNSILVSLETITKYRWKISCLKSVCVFEVSDKRKRWLMSYNCHYPILAATQCPALVTRGQVWVCRPGGSDNTDVSSINLTRAQQQTSSMCSQMESHRRVVTVTGTMRCDGTGPGGASEIFALSPTKSNVIEFVSFVTPSKVKFKNIYKMSESDLRGRNTNTG